MIKLNKILIAMGFVLLASCTNENKTIRSSWHIKNNAVSFCHNLNGKLVCSDMPSDKLGVYVVQKNEYI